MEWLKRKSGVRESRHTPTGTSAYAYIMRARKSFGYKPNDLVSNDDVEKVMRKARELAFEDRYFQTPDDGVEFLNALIQSGLEGDDEWT